MSWCNAFGKALAMVVAAGLGSSGCGEDECCSPFSPVYYAVAYGTVTQGGAPATGIEVEAEVFTAACPGSGNPTSNALTRSGAGGAYRLLLSSASPAEGQCLRLTTPGVAEPVLQTLTGMPFSAEAPAQVRDSIEINLELP
jgi:hypothetical protein